MYTIIFLIRGIVAQTKLFYHLHNADAEFDRLAASLIPDYRETIGYLSDIEERIDLTRIRLDHEGKEIIYSRECSEPADTHGSSWTETHFEVVSAITKSLESGPASKKILEVVEQQGTGGLYELAETLTNEFESLHADRQWDGEFYDEIAVFLKEKLSISETIPMNSETTYVLTGDLAAHFYSEGGIAAILEELPHQKFGLSSYDNGSHPEDIMNITIGESAFQIIEKWEFDLLSAIIHYSHSDWQTVNTILEKSRELALGIGLDLSGIPENCQGNYNYYFENRVFYPLI
jgi:hypothetical protein